MKLAERPKSRARGPAREDARLFRGEPLARMRLAAEEVAWLLGRNYPLASTVEFVGERHQLEPLQRAVLGRVACGPTQYQRRAARELEADDIARQALHIDGINFISTLEVALSGGLLFRGLDGALRDLVALRGNYDVVDETETALNLVGTAFARLRPARATFYLDGTVPNSGKLRAKIAAAAAGWKCPVEVKLVPSVDRMLKHASRVVSSDGPILDACESWFNFGAWIVERIVGGGVECIAL
jgi:hypothetical protein